MIDELVKLREIEYELNNIGMHQIAGDIGYLVSWLVSPEYNNGVHKKPDPAGPNTIDAGSNNCPIPYIVSVDDVKIEKESCDRSIPKFENFSITSSGTCDANVSSYLRVLRYLAQQKQTHTT